MADTKDHLKAVLERHGVFDAGALLDKEGESAHVATSSDPDVRMRGSVQLMKREKIARKTVDDGLSRLKHL